jgi:hypothetical protein
LAAAPDGVVPDSGSGVDGVAAGFAGDALAAEDTRSAVDFDAAAFEAGVAAARFEAAEDLVARGFDAARFDLDAGFEAARFDVAGFFAGARRLAAGFRVPAPAFGAGATRASSSSRRKRLPISTPASTTLRPCSMAVSRMFLGVSGMR